ncbi:MAG: thioredoxin domain-containing protein [Holosporales bacterium]|jgi:protein-disulfide isomerase|nr:thioredoxin domain-containing protein [Holosporales bacterium]
MGKESCASCGKVSVALSVLALAVAVVGYFRPYGKPGAEISDDQIRDAVLNAIKANPQVIVDAMGEGMAIRRDEEFKKLAEKIEGNKAEVDKLCMTFGKKESKNVVTCIIDPLCKHCVEFLKSMVKMSAAGHDVCFKLVPVAVLGADSVTIAKIYISCYEKNPVGALKVIEAVVNCKRELSKDVITQILKDAGFNSAEIESMMNAADAKIARNGEFAERMGIPLVPAIFVSTQNGVKFVQATSIEQITQEIKGGEVAKQLADTPVKEEESKEEEADES